MILYETGDVVLVNFPFSDSLSTKKRPSVIISSNYYNALLLDVLIIAITSQKQFSLGQAECFISDWEKAGLLKPSTIKPAIATIEKKLILKKLGRLTTDDLIVLKNNLKFLLDLEEN